MFYLGKKTNKWIQIEQRSMSSLIGAQIFFDQYSNFSWYLNGLRFRNLLTYYKNGILQTYVPENDFEFIVNTIKPRFLALEKELVDGINSVCSITYSKLNTLHRNLSKTDLSTMEDRQLANLFLDYYQITLNEVFLVNFKPLEISAMGALHDLVMEKSEDATQGQRDIAALAAMDKSSLSAKEESDLCQIVTLTLDPAKIKRALSRTKDAPRLLERNYPDLYELLEEHHNKYEFLIGCFSEFSWSIDDIIRRYSEILELGQEWADERLNLISNHSRVIGGQKRKIFKRLKDNGRIKKISKLISNLAIMGENNRFAYKQALDIRRKIYLEITERVQLSPKELKYYTAQEILDLINQRQKLNEKEKTRRERGVVFSSSVEFYSGADATRFLDKKLPIIQKRNVLTGHCVSPGLYEGPVRIIQNLEDAEHIIPGDIIVAVSAGYEFIEAYRKASAVIIESHGYLSPAAIICRELGIPCLIGVNSALASLNQDDVVIVDAEGQTVCFAPDKKGKQPRIDSCSIKVFDYVEDEPLVLSLEEVDPGLSNIFGVKATTQALLKKEGFTLPAGFALGRSAMYRFLESKRCKIVNNAYQPEMVEKARNALINSNSTDFLRSLPLNATIIFDEDGCAVRASRLPGDIISSSGPTTSSSTMAIRTLEGLWKAIRKCWLGFLDQPVAMIDQSNPHFSQPTVGGGVLIQQYKPGDRSGIILSQDTEHPGSNLMILEACLGTGHSLRTGRARPDRYRISRKTERIISRVIPLKTRFEMVQPKTGKLILIPVPDDIVEAEVLQRSQVKTLVSATLTIEKHLEIPVRIEWTIKGGDIYILNAEPLIIE